MKTALKLSILIHTTLFSCQQKSNDKFVEQWKNEIIQTEKDFAGMASSEGIAEAFLFYAAEEAVLERKDKLIEGRQSSEELFEKSSLNSRDVKLSWKPDFVDVSSSGDLGYTYGKYQYVTVDSLGNQKKSEGIFHTVWRRQDDGSWKYVWD